MNMEFKYFAWFFVLIGCCIDFSRKLYILFNIKYLVSLKFFRISIENCMLLHELVNDVDFNTARVSAWLSFAIKVENFNF